uniref:ABC transporter domain-containing protein n=1 Tax=Arcella intermedia TaxID=1963864 RepID=A0A6B2KZ86_9EUKA
MLKEDQQKQICAHLFKLLRPNYVDVPKKTAKLLHAPVNLSEISQKMDEEANKKIEWMKTEISTNYGMAPKSTRPVEADPGQAERNIKILPNAATFVKRRNKGNRVRDIQLKEFDIHMAGKLLLSNATLNLVYGRKYGLVGRNGIGKTTLMRQLSLRELPIPDMDILHVEQEIIGDDTIALESVLQADVERNELLEEEKKILAAKPKEGSQEESRLNTIYSQLADIDADKAPAIASSILAGLGFTTEMQGNTTKSFSGGWRMRLALARALFCQPELLLLDEPTNMLDIQAVLWLESYLRDKWKGTVLVISHDREFLNTVATDIIHFQEKKLAYYTGNYDTFEVTRTERLLNQKRAFESQTAQKAHIQKFIDKFRFNAKRASLVQSRLKKLSKMAPIPAVMEDPNFAFSFPTPDMLRPPVIQFTEVSFGYKPEKILFPKLNFSFDMESRVALVGANGQGKSTILSLICDEVKPRSGYIFRNARMRIGKFSQHHVDQMPLDKTPIEFLQRDYPGKDLQTYRDMLGRYGISGDMVFQKNNSLSGGQKSRVAFAHIGMKQPHIIILDEPTNHLDIETVDVLAQALNEFEGGIILVSHNERLISLVCDELWIVSNGTVVPARHDFEAYKKKLLGAFQ